MKKKWRINWRTVARNIAILTTVIALGLLIHKISENGISFLSTIGYFD